MTVIPGAPFPPSYGWFYAMSEIGDWLKQKRVAADLTLEEVAKMMDSTPTTISRYELGKRDVDYDVALRLAGFYGASRRETTNVWIASNGGADVLSQTSEEITYTPDPERTITVERYEGLGHTSRNLVDIMVQKLHEAEQRGSIGRRVKDDDDDSNSERAD